MGKLMYYVVTLIVVFALGWVGGCMSRADQVAIEVKPFGKTNISVNGEPVENPDDVLAAILSSNGIFENRKFVSLLESNGYRLREEPEPLVVRDAGGLIRVGVPRRRENWPRPRGANACKDGKYHRKEVTLTISPDGMKKLTVTPTGYYECPEGYNFPDIQLRPEDALAFFGGPVEKYEEAIVHIE